KKASMIQASITIACSLASKSLLHKAPLVLHSTLFLLSCANASCHCCPSTLSFDCWSCLTLTLRLAPSQPLTSANVPNVINIEMPPEGCPQPSRIQFVGNLFIAILRCHFFDQRHSQPRRLQGTFSRR